MTHIVAHNHVKIGNDVLMASKCFISDTNHGNYSGENQDSPKTTPNSRNLTEGKTIIGDRVWIGENAVILAGAEIGDGCIVGANSVVSKLIPSGSMVVGNNRIVKSWNADTKAWERI
ncbi:MAG: DapH/DapD/GlmU-related protein [Absicoccus porci]|uniref:DapH/DapD/GlmU-related protein n=1 Tax=Absicoccus porci TaxID=2486576 RepID=UPI0023F0CDA2|nr:DapH/DapD/GlmU-related protein [Absicoccus porci]MDD7331043.1 DapH/DapD/GlmU-related protein [Absicoccus porci]MDY4738003.1 DapH/DapD/GlmU-related protein [Absicoccus porci]